MTLIPKPNITEIIKELDNSPFVMVGEDPTNEKEFSERVTFYTDATSETEKPSPITWSAVETKYNEMMIAYNNNDYARKRAENYDTVGNQLDNLFHDINNNTLNKDGSFYKHIKSVKDNDPK
jgi:hypothetical protein